jgi:outer membrane protein OmpA-like peptidoglycan-associated protein
MKKSFLVLISVLLFSIGLFGQEIERKISISDCHMGVFLLFSNNKTKLDEASLFELDKLIEALQKCPTMELQLEGHTDNVGSAKANQKLSLQRASAVKTYLVNKKIDANRIMCSGFGELKPVNLNYSKKD